MKIEYGVLNAKKFKGEKLEEEINDLAKSGWRVKCAVGFKIILMRQIEIKEE